MLLYSVVAKWATGGRSEVKLIACHKKPEIADVVAQHLGIQERY